MRAGLPPPSGESARKKKRVLKYRVSVPFQLINKNYGADGIPEIVHGQ
jgi:hypothetical protein